MNLFETLNIKDILEKLTSEELWKLLFYISSMRNQPLWIPCTNPKEELPKKDLIVTYEECGIRYIHDLFYDPTEAYPWSGDLENIVAWMPYYEPKPYKED